MVRKSPASSKTTARKKRPIVWQALAEIVPEDTAGSLTLYVRCGRGRGIRASFVAIELTTVGEVVGWFYDQDQKQIEGVTHWRRCPDGAAEVVADR